MYKYGIDWYKENATDGGYMDDRSIRQILNYDDRIEWPETILKKMPNGYNSNITKCYIRFDQKTNIYYLIVTLSPSRRSTSSIITVILESDIFAERVEETIELPIILFFIKFQIISLNLDISDNLTGSHISFPSQII